MSFRRSQSNGEATRREFLAAGSLVAGGLMCPNTRQDSSVPALPGPRAKAVILLFCGGGMSHVDTFDPKPAATEEVRGPFATIRTKVPGVAVSEQLPRIARIVDQLTVVRSLSHDSDQHETATNWILSGRRGSAFGDYPAMGSVVADELAAQSGEPAYVALPGDPYFTWGLAGSSFLGPRCASYEAGDPTEAEFPMNADALSMISRAAFDISPESVATRDRYGSGTFGRSCLVARRLVEHGSRFVTVNFGGWDHHAKLAYRLAEKLPEFDLGFSALVIDLHQRGLLHETLLVAVSEFGRTPKINADGGRDHWPAAASAILAGAGTPGGAVIGATDRRGDLVVDRPMSPADLARCIFDAVGIDADKSLGSVDPASVGLL